MEDNTDLCIIVNYTNSYFGSYLVFDYGAVAFEKVYKNCQRVGFLCMHAWLLKCSTIVTRISGRCVLIHSCG